MCRSTNRNRLLNKIEVQSTRVIRNFTYSDIFELSKVVVFGPGKSGSREIELVWKSLGDLVTLTSPFIETEM